MNAGVLKSSTVSSSSSVGDIFRKIIDKLRRVPIWLMLHGRGRSIISSNCVGSRISLLAGEPFNSPTVNLWMAPDDYLTFVENLEAYRALDGAFREIPSLSAARRYPVASLGGGDLPEIQVNFMHYATLEEGVAAWRRRFTRVRLDRISLIFTDKDGANPEHLQRFDALPHPKLCFVHRPAAIRSAVYVRGFETNGEVGDLFVEWRRLAKVLSLSRLRTLRS